MIGFEELLGQCRVQAAEVERWVEAAWVRPHREGGALQFTEVDVARVRLICDLRDDLAVEEETIPVVLDLLDQVYGLRARLQAIAGALAEEPDEVRARVQARLAGLLEEDR